MSEADLIENLPTLDEIKMEEAERHLSDYIKQAWEVVEPGTKYVHGWHIDAICEHLEAVNNGEIRKLLINMPPRHMKSLTVSVFWPTWSWIKNPYLQWLYSSYSGGLSIRDSLKSRRLIQSDWYQSRWEDKYQLAGDQNAKVKFENDKTGYRIATSVGGQATGDGGDIIVVDDPHNAQEARSDTQRKSALIWWDETMSTRLNNPKESAKVIVMQRLHEKDLSGHVLEEKEGYEHLVLPAEYEPKRKCVTSIGYTDPREKEGELLWPKRFGKDELEDLKDSLGSYGYAGQMQQRPTPAEGGIFEKGWFDIVEEAPTKMWWVRYWDLAATEEEQGKDPDWTAGVKIGRKNGVYYIDDIQHFKLNPGPTEQRIKQTALLDGRNIFVGMEQEPGSSGKIVINHYQTKVLPGYAFWGNKVTGSKIHRAMPLNAAAEAGNIKLIKGDWNKAFLNEIELFPYGAHDDQIDGMSGGSELIDILEELMNENNDIAETNEHVNISNY